MTTPEDIRIMAGQIRPAAKHALTKEILRFPLPHPGYEKSIMAIVDNVVPRFEWFTDADTDALDTMITSLSAGNDELLNPGFSHLDDVRNCVGGDWDGLAAESFRDFFVPFDGIRLNQAGAVRALRDLLVASKAIIEKSRDDAFTIALNTIVALKKMESISVSEVKLVLSVAGAAASLAAVAAAPPAAGAVAVASFTAIAQSTAVAGSAVDLAISGDFVSQVLKSTVAAIKKTTEDTNKEFDRVHARILGDLAEADKTHTWKKTKMSIVEPPRPDLFVTSAKTRDWKALIPPEAVGLPRRR